MNSRFFIIISGPTGVGKTEFVDRIALDCGFPVEIINADMGQFYQPLSIGTAKPDYVHAHVKHHLFDTIHEPRDFTVTEFRAQVIAQMNELWSRGVVPIIVGGSGFYLKSLFFPPRDDTQTVVESSSTSNDQQVSSSLVLHGGESAKLLGLEQEVGSCGMVENRSISNERLSESRPLDEIISTAGANKQDALALWQKLAVLDSERARQIHPHDSYRVERALRLIQEGAVPSSCIPQFDPPGNCAFYFLTRDKPELATRINERVDAMVEAGWIAEVEKLDSSWREFLLRKKLIGYPELITYLENRDRGNVESLSMLLEQIKTKTRAYAKRQLTFWRMLSKKLEHHDPEHLHIKELKEVDLTLLSHELYLNLIRELRSMRP